MPRIITSYGFGIIEVLVAASIIALVGGGVVMLNSSVLRNTALIADRLIAFEWAQEGIEVARQIRDSNLIDNRPETDWKCFNPGIIPPPSAANTFDCGFNDPLVTASRSYRLDFTTDQSHQSRWVLVEGSETSQFPGNQMTREIRVLPILPTTPANLQKRLIKVTVKFSFGSREERVTLSTIVSNWGRET
ncbi:hypothetical protein HYZ64_03685 [Candidatus Berkelbacteria bacterium]|nr:hypothetical protein [Candidatus Berkelbacteria bacterium]